MMADLSLLEPAVSGDKFYDVFGRVLEQIRGEWGLKVAAYKCAELAPMVTHSWSMSFNFGMKQDGGPARYFERLAVYEAEYDKRFPLGIHHLLEKLA